MKLKESIKRKLSIAIVVVMMVSFMFAKTVSAKTFLQAAGGKLMEPVLNFAMFIGDAIENALDGSLYDATNRPWINVPAEYLAVVKPGEKVDYENLRNKFVESNHYNKAIYAKPVEGIDGWDVLEKFQKSNIIEMEKLSTELDMNAFSDDYIDVPNGAIYSPYEIFSNKIPLIDVNFLSPHQYKKNKIIMRWNDEHKKEYADWSEENGKEETIDSAAGTLQKVVSSWYVALRNIAIVALLSILLYLGIRIVISSSSVEKATYKQALIDWLIALILVFGMHYIMSFALTMTENISEILDNVTNPLIKVPINISSQVTSWSNNFTVITNLPGYVRLVAGIANSNENTLIAVEYAIIYLVMIAYTIMFTIIYIKRVIYMAFLTIIAPLTAVTYPFRKKNAPGGNAFAVWLREYIVNLLIQPIHLLLYSVVIGSTMQLAVEHPIYAIVALACLIPAQKLFFEIFGIRTPQYADTERTMHSERRAGRFAAYATGKAIKGAVKGIRMVASTVVGGALGAGAAAGAAGAEGAASGLEASAESAEGVGSGENIQSIGLSNGTNNSEHNRNKFRTNIGTKNTSTNISGYGGNDSSVDSSSNSSNQSIENTSSTSSKNETLNSENIQNAINKNILGANLGQAQINSQNTDIRNEFSGSNENKVEVGSINAQMNFEQVMKEVYPEYERNGISDIRQFNAAYSLEQGGISRQEAIATYKIAQETGDIRGNSELEAKWRVELTERISKTNEIQQLMENKSNEVNEKYSRLEKQAKQKYKNSNSSDPEYKELSRKMDEMLARIKNDKNNELEQIEQIPIRYADQIISQVEKYYDKLD